MQRREYVEQGIGALLLIAYGTLAILLAPLERLTRRRRAE